VPRQTRTKKVSAAQVRAYAGKAQEYVGAGANEIEAGRFIAATSLAVHAGINASDGRLRPADDQHASLVVTVRTPHARAPALRVRGSTEARSGSSRSTQGRNCVASPRSESIATETRAIETRRLRSHRRDQPR
jgi:hypothetical protein